MPSSRVIVTQLLVLIILIVLIACAAAPIKTESISFENKIGVQLPVNARLSIFMSPMELNKKYKSTLGLYSWELQEGERVQNAAFKVFEKLFREVWPYENAQKYHLNIKVNYLTQIQPSTMGRAAYRAEATILLYYGNGDFIEKFHGTGIWKSDYVNDEVALEDAYILAFQNIANQMLNSKKLSQNFINGFGDELAAAYPRPPSHNEPKVEREPSKYDDFFKSIVIIRTNSGSGTGFFITQDGFAITNEHVIGSDDRPSIKTYSGQTLFAKIVARDAECDLALLKVDINTSWLGIEKKSSVGIGDEVIAIGAPFALDYTVSKGIVSAKRTADSRVFIQTDAAINSGNSGGPLISLDNGRVVGIVTFGVKKNISEGLNFALSGKDIVHFIQEQPELRSIIK